MSAVLCQLLHEYCFQHRRSTTAARMVVVVHVVSVLQV